MFLAWSRNIACPEPRVVARHAARGRVYARLLFAGLPNASNYQPGIPAFLDESTPFEADAVPGCIGADINFDRCLVMSSASSALSKTATVCAVAVGAYAIVLGALLTPPLQRL